jgi:hypothetical protein
MYPADVERIMGKSYRQSRLLLVRIKKHLKKEEHQFVSVGEFCAFTGLPYEEVVACIKG